MRLIPVAGRFQQRAQRRLELAGPALRQAQVLVDGMREVWPLMDPGRELLRVVRVEIEPVMEGDRFVAFRARRYNPEQLEDCLARTGWATEIRSSYGGSERSKLTLTLLRKGT